MRLSSKYQGKQTLYVPAADSNTDYAHNIIYTGMKLDIQTAQNFNLADYYLLVAF